MDKLDHNVISSNGNDDVPVNSAPLIKTPIIKPLNGQVPQVSIPLHRPNSPRDNTSIIVSGEVISSPLSLALSSPPVIHVRPPSPRNGVPSINLIDTTEERISRRMI